jgi:hypothetical protein
MVFQLLSLLVQNEPQVVFLGGSAIQALFEKPKRLSIDLDISYPEEVNELVKSLEEAGYGVKERSSRSLNFLYYIISKDNVIVKLDIGRFAIPETETHEIDGTEILIPKKCYFLAAKLSSLALGTIGRFKIEPIQIIKDVYDIDCILELEVDLDHIGKNWKHIVTDQNSLRNKQFSEKECVDSIRSTLSKIVEVTPLPDFFIPQSALGGFEDYLFQGKIRRQELATMAARALLLLSNMNNGFYEIEKIALSESKDVKRLNEAEQILLQKEFISPEQIRALKIIAPKALVYLKSISI